MLSQDNNLVSKEDIDLKDLLIKMNDNLESQNNYIAKQQELDSSQQFGQFEDRKTANMKLIDEESMKDIVIRIYEKEINFTGGNIPLAQDIYYAKQLGLKLRHVEADIKGGSLAFDGDKYRSSVGDIKFSRIKLGFKDVVQGLIRKSNNEDFFWPAVQGYGQVKLDDTVKYIHMIRCVNPKRFIFENGVYFASAGSFNFGVAADTKIKSLALSKKNMFQMTLEGRGIVILELPVHPSELEYCKVEPGRPVRVNGNHVIYREGNVKRNVRMASTMFGSLASGAGFVEEYTGDGMVVLAPTLNVFEVIAKDLGEEAFEGAEGLKGTVDKWLGKAKQKTNRNDNDYEDYDE